MLRALRGAIDGFKRFVLSPLQGVDGDHQHIVARLESFSDIVIGFSLAQSAMNLVVTTTVEYFFSHPIGIFAYLVTFFLVARMWWTHSQIMHRFFLPNPLMIALNFAALAALGLMVFGLQLWLHRNGDIAGQVLALKFYVCCFAITIGTLAVMRAAGVYFRRAHLDASVRHWAFARSAGVLAMSIALVIGVFGPPLSSFFGIDTAPLPANMMYAFILGPIAARIARDVALRSDWGKSMEGAHA